MRKRQLLMKRSIWTQERITEHLNTYLIPDTSLTRKQHVKLPDERT